MAVAAAVGLTTGKRVLSTSIYSSELYEKLPTVSDHGNIHHSSFPSKFVIVAKRSSNFGPNYSSNKGKKAINVVKERRDVTFLPSNVDSCFEKTNTSVKEDELIMGSSPEAIILLQKSMLEKQLDLSYSLAFETTPGEIQKIKIIRSGLHARQRRKYTRRKCFGGNDDHLCSGNQEQLPIISPKMLSLSSKEYLRGKAPQPLSHAEVVKLCQKIKAGDSLEEHRKRLEERLGYKASDQQLASSMGLSYVELQSRLFECSAAKQKLLESNIRLVFFIAHKYKNMGVDMYDLVQGGLIGLMRGIEKFDSSRGFRLSTYVYWWIRQGVSKTLNEHTALELPSYLRQRLRSIKKATSLLESRGISATVSKISEVLGISERKILNAMEADRKVYSSHGDGFLSIDELSGEDLHGHAVDVELQNDPWKEFEISCLKDEVNNLLSTVLSNREREIIRLYHGLDCQPHSWQDISEQLHLSRERVRQVGLVAMGKLKQEARRRELEVFLATQ